MKEHFSKVFVNKLTNVPLDKSEWDKVALNNVECVKFDQSGYYCAFGLAHGSVTIWSVAAIPHNICTLEYNNSCESLENYDDYLLVWSGDSSTLARLCYTRVSQSVCTTIIIWNINSQRSYPACIVR